MTRTGRAVANAVPDDDGVVERVQAGDTAGFRIIMQRHNRRLYRVARGILGDDADAEDAVQDAYLRAFTNLAGFRGDSSLATWLTRIVINEALGRKRRRRTMLAIDNLDFAYDQGAARMPTDPRLDDPEAAVGRDQMRRLLEAAIDDLPEPFRIVFVMREIEQISVQETASHLQLRAETVKTRLHRARRLLRRALGERLGAVLHDAYAFDGGRCERLTEAVARQLEAGASAAAEPPRLAAFAVGKLRAWWPFGGAHTG